MIQSLGDNLADSYNLATDIAEFAHHNEGLPCILILEELQNSMSMHRQVGTSLSQLFEGKLNSGSLIRDKTVQELIQLHLELSELRDIIKVETGNPNDQSINNYSGIVSGATLESDRFGNTNRAYGFYNTNDMITLDSVTQVDILK